MKKANIIFVHGLWADGSGWNKLIPTLLEDGHKVISVQNPLTTLEDDVLATQKALARVEGPTILIGHSWGGAVITAAGNDPKVKGLVYVAALAPDEGESLGELSEKYPAEASNHLEIADGLIWMGLEGMQKHFAGDLPQEETALMYATQGPASIALFGAQITTTPAWKEKPNWYIIAKNDHTINPELEHFFADRMKATTIELESSHVPMISQPDAVLKVIRDAATSIQ
ncbi:alpha/beta hydrolase [Chryseobacterium sp. BIGb0232]|uniref:alpha/beta hydrolase n=1 Tax=Chryseobacterium sp. BIGb0232 TaxID=2940598 RepID=UPI000F461F63|nr:alpha/beta hydrolase [Chryseobacterium sp. BIGb0232]MCS4301964.1 pimeloyl-ACP methyl ester carboxylesterase [Chryseobacterium sp. BIGb0232]ROS17911.1 pimeloyl-ACP methyl ester carboxylesterase [Chryseobacterium nakagawai]